MAFLTLPAVVFLTVTVSGITSSVIEPVRINESEEMAMKIIHDLQAKIEVMEEKQMSLSNNVLLIQDQLKEQGGKAPSRTRRQAMDTENQGLPSTLAKECLPGTVGCPVNVVPYSVGASCIMCPAGHRGYTGPAGSPGRDGRDGRDALTIVTANDDSPQTVPAVAPSNTEPSNTSGVTYVRWGHSECPSSSTLIYSGVVGGSQYSASGNGANHLCLPPDPIYDEPVSGVGSARAFVYGVEYQIESFPARVDRQWHDLPCAVCKANSRFSKLMVPAKNSCPSREWTLEYGGYLMAERSHTNHQRSMYICVDREMQIVDRTHGFASDGRRALLDLVESRCASGGGGLPCGPYIDGYELTCAVCTL